MKRTFIPLIILVMTVVVPAIDLTAEVSLQSNYIWRGLKSSDGPVFQPSFTIARDDLSFSIWANMPLRGDNSEAFDFNRIDLTAAYERPSEWFNLSLGVNVLTFPHLEQSNTAELFAGVGLNVPLHPSVFVYQDVVETHGTYLDLGVSQSIPIYVLSPFKGIHFWGNLGIGSEDFKEAYFRWRQGNGPFMGGSGDQGGQGEGNGGGSGNGNKLLAENATGSASSGAVDLSVGIDLPFRVPLGEFSLNASYTRLLDNNIRSPRFLTDKGYFIVGATYVIRF